MQSSALHIPGIDRDPVVIFHKDHLLNPNGVNAGAETATIWLARTFSRLGIQTFVAAQLPADLAKKPGELFKKDGVTYINFAETFDTQAAFDCLENTLNLPRYHLIVASRAQALLESRRNSRILSRLFISHEPSASALGAQPKVIGKVADRVLCVSRAQADALIEAGCETSKITVIPNGADLDLFAPGDASTRDYMRLVFVGALVMDKGIHLLIDAFAALKEHFPKLTLDIYGSASMWGRENYFDIEEAKRIPGIQFHGAVSQAEIARAFRSAGLLVLPSMWFDSFPLTAVEAQVSGLPVLGSVHGGMKEVVRRGVTGELLDEISAQSIAQGIADLVQAPERLKTMSQQSLTLIRSNFSWENVARKFLDLMSEIESIHSHTVGKSREEEVVMKAQLVSGQQTGGRVGLLSTYNQECGLATYASYLVAQFAQDDLVILAEDVLPAQRTKTDGSNVRRCWNRGAKDFSRLQQELYSAQVKVLHLNCHYRFFDGPVFSAFLDTIRQAGIKVIAHIHNPFTVDPILQSLVSSVDAVVVHTPENKIEILANGGQSDAVKVIEHGVEVRTCDRQAARKRLGISANEKAIVTFGFVQPHKGIEDIIDALDKIRNAVPTAKLYVVGGPHSEDPSSTSYHQALQTLTKNLQLSDRVVFIKGFVSEETVDDYLSIADATVLNYRSQYFEASGALCRALGTGGAIITSTAPAFARLGSTVFHTTAGYPLPLALHSVLTNDALNSELRKNATEWSNRYSWSETAKAIRGLYRELAHDCQIRFAGDVQKAQAPNTPSRVPAQISSKRVPTQKGLKILLQNRSTAVTHPGGDTVVMETIAKELRERGVSVDIDLTGKANPGEYDLTHLFNFATPDVTKAYAEKLVAAGKPFVVTALYEDLPRFFNQMQAFFRAMQGYVGAGQPRDRWSEFASLAATFHPALHFDNAWVASKANVLLSSGTEEAKVLQKDYSDARRIEVCQFGCDFPNTSTDPDAFRRLIGVDRFVLCVGRLETRKNQLALLKALEDSDIPLVFVANSFTYQPEYQAACRQFKRRGKTIFLGRLDQQMLANAYAAAQVHALPSWYELPGLVSLEAARLGANIVASTQGTLRDYLGDSAWYAEPNDIEGLRQAVEQAFAAPRGSSVQQQAEKFTWTRHVDQLLEIYEQVLSDAKKSEAKDASQVDASQRMARALESIENVAKATYQATTSVGQVKQAVATDTSLSPEAIEAQKLCDQGDALLRGGSVSEAYVKYDDALDLTPANTRALLGMGVASLRQEKYRDAESFFQRTLVIDPKNTKALTGVGSVRWSQGKQVEAFGLFCKILENHPTEKSALLHLINASYALNRLTELEKALQRFLAEQPANDDIGYCLAGCFYKQGKFARTRETLQQILLRSPEHKDALELQRLLDKEASEGKKESYTSQVTSKSSDEIEETLTLLASMKTQKKYEEMSPVVRRVLGDSRANADQLAQARCFHGEILALEGDLLDADAEFKQAETNTTHAARALVGRGAVAAALERWSDSESFFRRALTLRNDSDTAFAGIGICASQRGDLKEAWAQFQRALALNPENMRALLGLVQVGYPLGKLREVETGLLNYLEMHPANLSILYSYAGCCFAQGKNQDALQQLQKIFIFDPNHRLARELESQIQGQATAVATSVKKTKEQRIGV